MLLSAVLFDVDGTIAETEDFHIYRKKQKYLLLPYFQINLFLDRFHRHQ